MLTFVVGGGGYTGVETTAALNDLVRDGRASESDLGSCDASVLVEPGDRLMAETTPELAAVRAAEAGGARRSGDAENESDWRWVRLRRA